MTFKLNFVKVSQLNTNWKMNVLTCLTDSQSYAVRK
jgi:hypothetical protein